MCSHIDDFSTGALLAGAEVSLVSAAGVPLPGKQFTTLQDGSFYLCAPVDTPFYVTATDNNYVASSSALLDEPGGPDNFFPWLGGFAMVLATDLGAFQGLFQDPPYVPGTSLIVVIVSSELPQCDSQTGYKVGVALPDGGTLADGGPLPYGVVYVADDFPDLSLTATTDAGTAIVYNIDSTLTNGFVVVTVSNPNVPQSCLVQNLAQVDSTGLVPVSQGSFSVEPISLP